MEVIDCLYGNPGTKYENKIDRLICKSSDGIVNVQTSALTEDDMELVTKLYEDNEIVGKIVTIQCSGLSENSKGDKALLHPRFVCIREDKEVADSFEDMKRIEEMCSSLA